MRLTGSTQKLSRPSRSPKCTWQDWAGKSAPLLGTSQPQHTPSAASASPLSLLMSSAAKSGPSATSSGAVRSSYRNDPGSEGPAMWRGHKTRHLRTSVHQVSKRRVRCWRNRRTWRRHARALSNRRRRRTAHRPKHEVRRQRDPRLPLRGHVISPARRAQGRVELPAQVGVPRGVAPCRTAPARARRSTRPPRQSWRAPAASACARGPVSSSAWWPGVCSWSRLSPACVGAAAGARGGRRSRHARLRPVFSLGPRGGVPRVMTKNRSSSVGDGQNSMPYR